MDLVNKHSQHPCACISWLFQSNAYTPLIATFHPISNLIITISKSLFDTYLEIDRMPAYHSAYNDVPTEEVATIASLSILPFRSKVRGPAPPPLANPPPEAEGLDIIDEALDLFRPNSLFRNFEIKGGADRLLIYLILFISQCLSIIAGSRVPLSQAEAIRQLSTTAVDQFHLPGDAGFPLNNLYAAPANRMEAGEYLLTKD